MDWSKGFSSRYYVSIVDPNTWADMETLQITGGSITRSDDDLQEAASLDFTDYDRTEERWVRVWLDARQDGDLEHIPLFTGLAVSPNYKIEGTSVEHTVQCYSVLKPADDVLLQKGWYASKGRKTEDLIRELLSPTKAIIDFEENCPGLSSDIISENNETNLTMVQAILEAVEWRMLIRGDGSIYVSPYSKNYSESFDSLDNDVLETSISANNDWFNCPNVFRAISDGKVSIYRDEDLDSKYSIPNRGREIWAEETDLHLNDGETIEQYAERRLKEKQQSVFQLSYNRRFFPNVYVSDLIYLDYPAQNIDGAYYVKSQTIELSHGATVSEVVEKV